MAVQQALTFNVKNGLQFAEERAVPTPGKHDALLQILRAGICSTDLEILKGYVAGYDGILGHECVARVLECATRQDLVGSRVTTEINCRTDDYRHPTDATFTRNHAPKRVVLGIIAKDGVMAQCAPHFFNMFRDTYAGHTTCPENLHVVPDSVTDREACFTEPLAAACRIVEQQVIGSGDKVAVIGDGKLGLLVAQVLVLQGAQQLTHFGRHQRKLDMLTGTVKAVVSSETATEYARAFDVCVEASGSSRGIELALALSRPLGCVVLKSTCSLTDLHMPQWTAIANDIVVNEKRLLGSRCGPFPPALQLLQDPRMKRLVNSMVDGTFLLSDGLAAFQMAKSKGALKVQLVMGESQQESADLKSAEYAEQQAEIGAGAAATEEELNDDEPTPRGQVFG